MRVEVLVFGVLREVMGAARRELAVREGVTAGDVVRLCRESSVQTSGVWDSLAVAVNQEYSQRDRVLADGDVVALLPPVSGGSGRGLATAGTRQVG